MSIPDSIDHYPAEVRLDELEDGINIYHFEVDLEHRRKGVGTQILTEVEELARQNNKQYIVINMKGREKSQKFLEQNNYTLVETVNDSVTAEKEV